MMRHESLLCRETDAPMPRRQDCNSHGCLDTIPKDIQHRVQLKIIEGLCITKHYYESGQAGDGASCEASLSNVFQAKARGPAY